MRTPGEDEELAVGFLAGEGLIAGATDVESVGLPADLAANTIEVRTTNGLRRDPGARSFYTTSSCGVCGKGALEFVRVEAGGAPQPPPQPQPQPPSGGASPVQSAPRRGGPGRNRVRGPGGPARPGRV